MKISDARDLYGSQLSIYQEQQNIIREQLDKLHNENPDDSSGKAAVLELSLKKLSEKEKEYHDYLGIIAEQKANIANFVSANKQGESMAEAAEDMSKIMLIARRIMQGGKVPPEDEKKLMEFDKDLYLMAKSAGALAKEHEEYDSLWDEDGKKQDEENPMETADNAEAVAGAPEIVSTDKIIAEASAEAGPDIAE